MKNELKPYPICGSTNIEDFIHMVVCLHCGLRLGNGIACQRIGKDCHEAWNKRPEDKVKK